MVFETVAHDKKFMLFSLLLYVFLCAYFAWNILEKSTTVIFIFILIMFFGSIFLLYLFIIHKVPIIKIDSDHICLDRKFLGKTISTQKTVNLENLVIKLRKDDIKFFPLKKIFFIFKPCKMKVVNGESGSFFKRRSFLRVLNFKHFVNEVFRRVKYAEIDAKSLEYTKKLNIELGVNIQVVGKKRTTEGSVAQEFISDHFIKDKDTEFDDEDTNVNDED